MKEINELLKAILLFLIIFVILWTKFQPEEVAEWHDKFINYKSKVDLVEQEIRLINVKNTQIELEEMKANRKRLYNN